MGKYQELVEEALTEAPVEDFDKALSSFIKGCQKIHDDYLKRMDYDKQLIGSTIVHKDGKVYIKVMAKSNSTGGLSAFCFVSKDDNLKKGFKKGDVLKPAGWNAPAKGSRGNILDKDNGLGRIGPHGPAYNR